MKLYQMGYNIKKILSFKVTQILEKRYLYIQQAFCNIHAEIPYPSILCI